MCDTMTYIENPKYNGFFFSELISISEIVDTILCNNEIMQEKGSFFFIWIKNLFVDVDFNSNDILNGSSRSLSDYNAKKKQ